MQQHSQQDLRNRSRRDVPPRLASTFGMRSPVLRSNCPLSDDEIRAVAPSIFAEGAHSSRSKQYRYIPTASVLTKLRAEGFQPFMVCQTRVRKEGRRDYTKHMIRLRHASQVDGGEANEIILLNSHDGTSSYQMLAGMFRFVCENGLVCGDTVADVRVPHKGEVTAQVVEGAYAVLRGFDHATDVRERMHAVTLDTGEAEVFGLAALALKYEGSAMADHLTGIDVLSARRTADSGNDLWTLFNRVQENLIRGGLSTQAANGRRVTTRAVQGIDSDIRLNRALWLLAEGMRRLKG